MTIIIEKRLPEILLKATTANQCFIIVFPEQSILFPKQLCTKFLNQYTESTTTRLLHSENLIILHF